MSLSDFTPKSNYAMRLEADALAVNLSRAVARGGNAGLAVPVLGFAAFSGTGKTTLLCELVPLLRARGLRLGLLKHSHHAFEVDRPGKDSFLLRQAGAAQLVVASRQRSVVLQQHPEADDPAGGRQTRMADFLHRLNAAAASDLDLLLVEGYKYAPLPKIELHRPSLGHPLLAPDDPLVIAVASDGSLRLPAALPLLDINAPAAVAAFVLDHYLPVARASQQV